MNKVYKITEAKQVERRIRTPDGQQVTYFEDGWYIEYRNSAWTDASVKCVFVTYPEHLIKFTELLSEAGYTESK